MATGFAAGQSVTADALNAWLPVSAVKIASTSRNSTTVPADDPDLSVTLLANARYWVQVNLGVSGPTAADIQIGYKRTGTVTQVAVATGREFVGPPAAATSVTDTTMRNQKSATSQPDSTATYGTTTTAANIREAFWVDGGTSGGTLTLQWAQGTSDVSNTTLTGYIVATRVA